MKAEVLYFSAFKLDIDENLARVLRFVRNYVVHLKKALTIHLRPLTLLYEYILQAYLPNLYIYLYPVSLTSNHSRLPLTRKHFCPCIQLLQLKRPIL